MSPAIYSGYPRKKDDRQRKHQDGTNHPVLHQRQQEDFLVAEHFSHFLVADFGERRVHHQDQPGGDWNRGRAHAEAIQKRNDTGQRPSGEDADEHGGKDPHGKETVQEFKTRRNGCMHAVPLVDALLSPDLFQFLREGQLIERGQRQTQE